MIEPFTKMTAHDPVAIVVCGNKDRFLDGWMMCLWEQDLSVGKIDTEDWMVEKEWQDRTQLCQDMIIKNPGKLLILRNKSINSKFKIADHETDVFNSRLCHDSGIRLCCGAGGDTSLG